MISVKKYSHIKKQVILEKQRNFLCTHKCVLFFHYNGEKECNWQQLKEKILQNVKCKSMLVHNNLGGELSKEDQFFLLAQIFQGTTLLVACAEIAQMVAVMKICTPPQFLCLTGRCNDTGKNTAFNYLDLSTLWKLDNNSVDMKYVSTGTNISTGSAVMFLQLLLKWQSFYYILQCYARSPSSNSLIDG